MADVDIPLTLAQAVWLAGLLSTAGTLLFAAMEGMRADRGGLSRLVLISVAVADAGWVAWVLLEGAALGDGPGLGPIAKILPVLVRQTEFGHLAVAQLVLLNLSSTVWRRGGRPAAAAAALALAAAGLQVGHLHAWAIEGGVGLLSLSALLHLWAASVWLGGLLPLRLLVAAVQPALAAAAVRRFSRLATFCVVVLAGTALLQGSLLVGGTAGLLGTLYGRTLMLKAVLFAVLVAVACYNRFALTPALARPDPQPARRALLRMVAIEAVAGVAIVIVAALLSSLPPGIAPAALSGQ